MRTFLIPLLVVAVPPGLTGRARAEEDPARQVLEKAIGAHGGAERLSAVKAVYTEASGTMDQMLGGIKYMQRSWFQEPWDRVRSEMKVTDMKGAAGAENTIVTVVNGPRGWVSLNGDTRPMDTRALAQAKEHLYVAGVHRLVSLRDPSYQLSIMLPSQLPREYQEPERPEPGSRHRPAVGIQVASVGRPRVWLFFDKATWLLVRADRPDDDRMGASGKYETKIFDLYEPADGIPWAKLVTVWHMPTDQLTPFLKAEVKKVEFRKEKFRDEQLFDKPVDRP